MSSWTIQRAAVWLLAAGAVLAAVSGCRDASQASPSLDLLDLAGNRLDPFQEPAEQALLFLFVRSDCPISNRYAPELQRLSEEFSPQGVAFYLVYPEKGQPTEEIRRHMQEYGFPGRALRDPSHDLVELADARITPEAAIFSPQGELLYRGRIDDRWVDFGKARAAASQHDLQEALEAVLAGKPVPHPRTQAVGCYISDLK